MTIFMISEKKSYQSYVIFPNLLRIYFLFSILKVWSDGAIGNETVTLQQYADVSGSFYTFHV